MNITATKKFISLTLAGLMATSGMSLTAYAETDTAESSYPTQEQAEGVGEQKIYFEFPADGTWGDLSQVKTDKRTQKANVYCYAYAVYGNEYEYVPGEWQSKVQQCTWEHDNVFSFDLNSPVNTTLDEIDPETGKRKKVTYYRFVEPDADYAVILSFGMNQTAEINLSADCIGDTVVLDNPVNTRENAANSMKLDHLAHWKNHPEVGTMANITGTGKYQDGQFPKHQPRAQILSNALKQYLANILNNGFFKKDNNLSICDKLGVTPAQVYEQYIADNAGIIANGKVESANLDTSEEQNRSPVDFIRYTDVDYKGNSVEKKLAAPEAVKEVLGLVPVTVPTTEEPTTAEPTEVPTTEEPTTAEPTEVPTTEEPTTAEPTTVEPITAEPTTVEPATAESTTVEPTTAEPTTAEPTEPTYPIPDNAVNGLVLGDAVIPQYKNGQIEVVDGETVFVYSADAVMRAIPVTYYYDVDSHIPPEHMTLYDYNPSAILRVFLPLHEGVNELELDNMDLSVKVTVEKADPCITGLMVEDMVLPHDYADYELNLLPSFSAEYHGENGTERIDFNLWRDEFYTDTYLLNIEGGADGKLPKDLAPGEYTLKASLLDAETTFKVTVKPEVHMTDFEFETDYDEYLSRGGALKLTSITFDNGETETAFTEYRLAEDWYQVSGDYFRFVFHRTDDDPDPWSRGTHHATIVCDDSGVVKEVTYQVNESKIDRIEYLDKTVVEGSAFDIEADYIIYYKDGTVYDSRDDSVGGFTPVVKDEIWYISVDYQYKEYQAGDVVTVTAMPLNNYHVDIPELSGTFTVTFSETPIASVSIKDLDLVLGMTDNDPYTTAVITFKNGQTVSSELNLVSGSGDDVRFNGDLFFVSMNSSLPRYSYNDWKPGSYACKVTVGSVEGTFTLNLLNPMRVIDTVERGEYEQYTFTFKDGTSKTYDCNSVFSTAPQFVLSLIRYFESGSTLEAGTKKKLSELVTLGDANGDGKVDIIDATNIQRVIAEYDSFTGVQSMLCDLNNDGEINVSDVTLAQKLAAELITSEDL